MHKEYQPQDNPTTRNKANGRVLVVVPCLSLFSPNLVGFPCVFVRSFFSLFLAAAVLLCLSRRRCGLVAMVVVTVVVV